MHHLIVKTVKITTSEEGAFEARYRVFGKVTSSKEAEKITFFLLRVLLIYLI